MRGGCLQMFRSKNLLGRCSRPGEKKRFMMTTDPNCKLAMTSIYKFLKMWKVKARKQTKDIANTVKLWVPLCCCHSFLMTWPLIVCCQALCIHHWDRKQSSPQTSDSCFSSPSPATTHKSNHPIRAPLFKFISKYFQDVTNNNSLRRYGGVRWSDVCFRR